MYSLYRRQPTVSVEIADLDAGSIVDKHDFVGSMPGECPQTHSFSPLKMTDTIDGDLADVELFLPWLKNVMAPYGFK
jgi:hypothetical protein